MKRHALGAFFVLAFLFSWGLWIPAVAAARGAIRFAVPPERALIWGAFGPALAALIITAWIGGTEAVRHLFARLLVWRVRVVWYGAALLLPAVISLLTTALHTMFGNSPPDFADLPIRQTILAERFAGYSPWATVVPLFLYQLVAGTSLAEELGWRAFVLPRLQQRCTALTASMLLAACWAFWVWPQSFTEGGPPAWWALFYLFLGAVPGSILTTWIFNNSKGSLLLVVLFNNAFKVTGLLLASAPARPAVALAPYWLVAITVAAVTGADRLSRGPLDANCVEPIAPEPRTAPAVSA
jgi:membrane protease YdiL (CAAX protease family)